MRFLVRLDASSEIGTGHFRRMRCLEKVFEEKSFFYLIKTDQPKNRIFENVDKEFLHGNETEELKRLAPSYTAVIFDMLHYEPDYLKKIKSELNLPLISFHEYSDYSSASDLAINPNFIDTNNLPNFVKGGAKYILFDEELKSYLAGNLEIKTKDHVLISFGGSDPSHLTLQSLIELPKRLPDLYFCFHVGYLNNDRDAIMKLSKQHDNVQILVSPIDISRELSQARVILSAGGNIMYESMLFGKKPIIIAHNTHQICFAENADRIGNCSCLGLAKDVNWDEVAIEIQTAYFHRAKPKVSVDCDGSGRIKKQIVELARIN